MERYLGLQDWMVALDGKGEVLSWEEFARRERTGREALHIFWTGCVSRKIAVKGTAAGTEISGWPGFQGHQERFTGGEGQLVGVLQDGLNTLYACVPPARVKTSVPFSLAARAFLLGQGARTDRINIMIDRLPGRTLITALGGMFILEERMLMLEEPERIVEEVRRTSKNAQEACASAPGVTLWTNSRPLAAALLSVYSPENVIETADKMSADVILSGVRFGMHFSSEKELARAALAGRLRGEAGRLALLAGFLIILFTGGGILADQCRVREARVCALREELRQEKEALGRAVRERYQGYVRAQGRCDHARILAELLADMPSGWKVRRFSSEGGAGKAARVKAVISGERLYVFRGRGVWSVAAVTEGTWQGKPMRELSLLTEDPG